MAGGDGVTTDADAHVTEWMFHKRAEAEAVAAALAFDLQKQVGERAYWARVDPSGLHPHNDMLPLPTGESEEDRLTVRMWQLRDELSDVTRRLRELQTRD